MPVAVAAPAPREIDGVGDEATQGASTPMMRAFAGAVRGNVPIVVWGDPAVGKTAKIGAYAAAWVFHTETVVGSIREASDFLGLPIEVDGEVRCSPPAFARRAAAADRAFIPRRPHHMGAGDGRDGRGCRERQGRLAIPGTTALANQIPAGATSPRRARDVLGELMTRRTWAA